MSDRIYLNKTTYFVPSTSTHFNESTYWDGRNHISRATRSQWEHEELFKTAGGKWVLHCFSQWQGTGPGTYRQIEDEEAFEWLAYHGHDEAVPESVLYKGEI